MNSNATSDDDPDPNGDRQRWMAVLAQAACSELESAWEATADKSDYSWLRKPETGMSMIRARTGSNGQPFNLGEVTVTRCALTTGDGEMGVAYIKGRDHRHAELAALFDALLQDEARHDEIEGRVIAPLERSGQERQATMQRKAAATRVDFFTMATGRQAE